jgi:signal transduction histidine kinase
MIKHQLASIPVQADIAADDMVYGVKSQILEALFNLMDNDYEATEDMMKYRLTPEARCDYHPSVKVKFEQFDGYSQITISDNGSGIQESDKKRIFVPYFTTKSSYKKSGSGIGMFVVYKMIVENHGGKIWFDSQYLKGTTFYIKLPKKGRKISG